MELNDLIGLSFKYISKYDGKESSWTGTVEWVNTICSTNGITFTPQIIVKNKNGSTYDLNQLIFFYKQQIMP